MEVRRSIVQLINLIERQGEKKTRLSRKKYLGSNG
jgi:hypothetical protein